jgi:phage baseplate assembly protein W
MPRQDYGYPFRIDPARRQGGQSAYADHVGQMIRQVLLTDPGERVNLPEFGCGLRRLVFAPYSDALQSTVQMLVMQSLNRWLGNQVQVNTVSVSRPGEAPDGQMNIEIDYVLIETREQAQASVEVR